VQRIILASISLGVSMVVGIAIVGFVAVSVGYFGAMLVDRFKGRR
jgi:hypothetical protein